MHTTVDSCSDSDQQQHRILIKHWMASGFSPEIIKIALDSPFVHSQLSIDIDTEQPLVKEKKTNPGIIIPDDFHVEKFEVNNTR